MNIQDIICEILKYVYMPEDIRQSLIEACGTLTFTVVIGDDGKPRVFQLEELGLKSQTETEGA